jgi:hypothetical protein
MTDEKNLWIDRIWKWIGRFSLSIFVASMLVSIWVETLIPIARAGDTHRLIYNLLGIPLILIGLGGIIFGGYLFLKNMLQIGSLESYRNNIDIISTYPSPEKVQLARRKNIRLLLLAWKPGIRLIFFRSFGDRGRQLFDQ